MFFFLKTRDKQEEFLCQKGKAFLGGIRDFKVSHT